MYGNKIRVIMYSIITQLSIEPIETLNIYELELRFALTNAIMYTQCKHTVYVCMANKSAITANTVIQCKIHDIVQMGRERNSYIDNEAINQKKFSIAFFT